MSNILGRLETEWLAASTEEEVFFCSFKDRPRLLRRSSKIKGALADLKFGNYRAMDHSWVKHDKAVWLDMITSDEPGDGKRLLKVLIHAFKKSGVALIGAPTPLRPRDWPADRQHMSNQNTLICWYLGLGFRVVQDGSSNTRIIHTPRSSMLVSDFQLQ